MTQRKCLITGAAGFIGSNLCRRFVNEGWDVTGVDDMSNGRREFLPAIARFVQDDFACDAVLNGIRGKQFDVVLHLAALPRVSYSVEHPMETHENNVTKTVKLLDACRGNVRRFVNTSSSSVYGGAETLPTPELYPHNPVSPYALHKSVSEQYCRVYSAVYGLDTVSVRPFNVFGPNQLGNSPYSLAVSSWLHAVKHGKPLRSDGDGTQSRDITYVTNVVDLFFRCANHEGTFKGEAFNGGTGARVTNNEVLEWFKKHYPDCEVINAPWRAGDVMHTQADISSAKEILGYEPKIDFWRGLELTHSWAMNSSIF